MSYEHRSEIFDTTLLEKILHSKKLNYETLAPLVKRYIDSNKIVRNENNTVNIFIDYYDIIKPLYNPTTIEDFSSLKTAERFMVSSEILNNAAHYRHFFYSRLKMFTNIIFYYSDKKDRYKTSVNADYKHVFYDKRMSTTNPTFGVINEVFQKNIKLIKSYCQYVPHVYFINSGEMDYSLIPHMFLSSDSLMKQSIINPNDTSIIISNEDNHFQDLIMNDKVLQLQIRGKENSCFISAEDIIPYIVDKHSKTEHDYTILPDLFPIIYALSGDKTYIKRHQYWICCS